MAGKGVSFVLGKDDKKVRAAIKRVQKRAEGLKPWFMDAAEYMIGSVQRNFEAQGRPERWEPLKPVTIEQKKKAGQSPLILHGRVSAGLRHSVNTFASRDELRISPDKVYGRIHQLGGKAGRGLSVTIPARPFLMFQNEDESYLERSLRDYVAGAW